MRKRISFSHFSRTSSHYHAMMKNMCMSLIEHERIITTEPKAKAMRKIAENVSVPSTTRCVLLIVRCCVIILKVDVDHAFIYCHMLISFQGDWLRKEVGHLPTSS